FISAWQFKCAGRFGLFELFFRRRTGGQVLTQLTVDLNDGLSRLVCLHAGRDAEDLRPQSTQQKRVSTIRPTLVLPEVHVDTSRERAADDIVDQVGQGDV